MASFGVWDYVVLLATVGVCVSIGIFFAIMDRKKNTPSDYFFGGRSLSILPAALSFVVTFQSSLMILGSPAEVYLYGMRFAYNCVGIVVAYTFAGVVLVPVFHSLQVTSVYKYFELRYGSNEVRYLAVATGIMYNILYMSIVTYGTCVALEVVIGIPYWGTILLYTTVCTIYTTIGGIKAVIWTDVFQFIVMGTGVIAVLVKSIHDAGGLSNTVKVSTERLDMNDFRLDPRIRVQFWNVSAGSFSLFLFCSLTQAGIQRISAMPNVRSARILCIISGPIYCIFFILTALEGATIFAYYDYQGCDIIASGQLKNVNEIIPVTILELFHGYPGLSGLFIASLSSAALSTLSSCLSALSAITYEDAMKVKYPNISDSKATRLSKFVVVFYGFVAMAVALLMSRAEGSVTMLYSIFIGGIDGPTGAIFCLSILFRRSTTKGMLVGGACGIVISVWIALGQIFADLPPYPILPAGSTENCNNFPKYNTTYSCSTDVNSYNVSSFCNISTTTIGQAPDETWPGDDLSPIHQMYTISYMFITFVGFSTTTVVGLLVSLCTKMPETIDTRCLFTLQKKKKENYVNPEQTNNKCINEQSDLMAETVVQ